MGQHFKLTSQEYHNNTGLFKILEIKAEQVIDKDYQELSSVLKKQYRKLILVHHPDKGGNEERFKNLDKAYKELNAYIEPLESGNPCVKVSVGAESNGRLTAREFHYRKKLFKKLKISEKEAVGKGFSELFSILTEKSSSLNQDLRCQDELIHDINYWAGYGSLFDDKVKKLRNEFDKHLMKPNMQLFNYISPLKLSRSLSGGNVQKSVSNRIFNSTQFLTYQEKRYQVEI